MSIPIVYGADTYGSGTYGQLTAPRHGVDSVGVGWNPASPSAYDVLPAVRVSIQRGRTSERQSIEQGRCLVEVHDPDHVYDPSNASSPIAADLKVMRVLTVYSAVDDGSPARAVFTGYVSRMTHDPDVGAVRTVIEAVDGYEWLATIRPTIAATGATTVGVAIGLLLDAAGVPADRRDVDGGDAIPDFEADGTLSALGHIEAMLTVDRGVFVVFADATYAYRDRSWFAGAGTASATITRQIAEVFLPSRDVLNVVNKQTVQRTGGTAQTAEDVGSQLSYRVREGAQITSAYLVNDTQAASLASYVVLTHGEPDEPTRELRVPGLTAAQLVCVRDREIADLVTLSGIGAGGDVFVEGVRHEIERGQHSATYYVTPRAVTAFTIGVSTVEGAHVIGY